MTTPKLGLALGAGAARGLAHIGVLQVLEENGLCPTHLAGTSIGAVIGGLYAADIDLELLARMAKSLDWNDLVRLTVSPTGLVSSERIFQMLRVLTKEKNIEDLKIPCAFVACDLHTGQPVIFDHGPAALAVRASLSIPGVFTPVEHDGRMLVDGAVVLRVPDTIPARLGADFTLAVDLGFPAFRGRLRALPDIVMRTVEILEREAASSRIPAADFTIHVDMPDVTSTQLNRAEEIIARGRAAAEEGISELRRLLSDFASLEDKATN